MKKFLPLALILALFIVFCGNGGAPTMKLDRTVAKPGENIVVTWTAPSGYANNAWIGIIPSDIPHGDESKNDSHDLTYQYLSGKTSGTFTFKAPGKPGKYDFRMHDTDSSGKEVAFVSFEVK